MQIYFLASESERADLTAAIADKFGGNSRKVAPSQWLLAAHMTPQEVSNYLDASNGRFGKIIILVVTAYFGWHDKDIWDWITLKRTEN